MTTVDESPVEAAPDRSRPCAYCGRPVRPRNRTGRPPRYCPPTERDCQAKARAERLTARALETTGGAPALRQVTADLGRQLDDVWEPVHELAETLQSGRDLLAALRDDLIAQTEQAQRDAESATADREEADKARDAAEKARDEALAQTGLARTDRDKALRAQDEAEARLQDALRQQERLKTERDLAVRQAQTAVADAAARVDRAVTDLSRARETAAARTAELNVAREHLRDYRHHVREAMERIEQVRRATADEIHRIRRDTTEAVTSALDQARSQYSAQQRQLIDLGGQLGDARAQAEHHRQTADRHAALLSRVTGILAAHRHVEHDSAEPDTESGTDRPRHCEAQAALDAITALLRDGRP